MTKREGEFDYSEYYLKNYMKESKSDFVKEYYQNMPEEVPENRVTYIPKIVALAPDEIDAMPYGKNQERAERRYAHDYQQPHAVNLVSSAGAGGEGDNLPDKGDKHGKKCKNKKHNKYRSRGIAIAVITIIICCCVTLLIADSVSGGYIFDEMKTVFTGNNNEVQYYAVETGSYVDMQTARVYGLQLSSSGGAGYVINDGSYRVIAEIYPSKSDADIVAARLSTDGYDAKVYPIAFQKIVYEHFPQSARNVTKKSFEYVDIAYRSLYNIAINLASKKIDLSGAASELKTLSQSMRNILIDYEANVDNHISNAQIMKVRVQLGAVVATVENLLAKKSEVNELLSHIRYSNAMILNTHRALCADLAQPI